jgi:methyltransferase (TIGR00027 family)
MGNSIFTKDATAQGVAKQRLIESLAKANKRVIFDPYADRFVAGSSLIKLMGHSLSVWITKLFAPGFHEHLIARTRFIDDLVTDACAKDIQQYVILGSGYDLRAHRLSLPDNVQIFEVDQQDVQLRKQKRLPTSLQHKSNLTYVSVDFNHQVLSQQLLDAGFDQSKPTLFTLEGVSQYIPKEAVNATVAELRQLTEQSRAIFFISYVHEHLNSQPELCFGKGYVNAVKRANIIKKLAEKFGEPWISFYTPQQMKEMLKKNGFTLTEDKSLADLNVPYFAPVNRQLAEHQILKLEQFVVAKSD